MTKSEQSKCAVDVPAEMDGGLKKKDVLNRISANGRYIGQPKQLIDWPSGLARYR